MIKFINYPSIFLVINFSTMSSKKGTPSSTPTLFNFFKKIDPPQFPSPNASPKTPTSTTSKKTSPSSKNKQPLSDKKHSPNQQEDSMCDLFILFT